MQLCCDEAGITLNKNTIPGDTSAANPSGVRIGTPALTTRGMKEAEFERIGDWLHEVVKVAKELQRENAHVPTACRKELAQVMAVLHVLRDVGMIRTALGSVFSRRLTSRNLRCPDLLRPKCSECGSWQEWTRGATLGENARAVCPRT